MQKNPYTIGLKTWNWLPVEVIACGIPWIELEKKWNLQLWSTKKPHNLGVPLFGGRISGGVAHFYGISLANTFNFSRNVKLQWSIYKGISSTIMLVSFRQQTTDSQIELLFCVLRYYTYFTGLQSVAKIMGKSAIWIILCFYSVPPLSNVEKQWPKIGSSYVMGSQHWIVGDGEF